MSRAIALLFLLSSAACGSSSAAVVTTSPSPSGRQFQLEGIHTSASGKILVTASGDSTTIELTVSGLAALSAHASNLMSGSCRQPIAVIAPLNQVVADGTGKADVKTTIQQKFPPASGSWFVVVDAGPDTQGLNGTYLLCGNVSTGTVTPSPTAPPLQFAINGIKTAATGKILVTAGGDTTTIEVVITGLNPDSSHVSHVHSGDCQHQGGIIFALNQVVADGTGAADARTAIQAHYPPASGHWYVVVHAGPDMQGSNAAYLMCGNLF